MQSCEHVTVCQELKEAHKYRGARGLVSPECILSVTACCSVSVRVLVR